MNPVYYLIAWIVALVIFTFVVVVADLFDDE